MRCDTPAPAQPGFFRSHCVNRCVILVRSHQGVHLQQRAAAQHLILIAR
jgi:hypothetical protein